MAATPAILAACGGTAAVSTSASAAPASPSSAAARASASTLASAPASGSVAASPAAPASPKPSSASKLQLPTYTPANGPKPDVPGSDVLPDAFVNYPKTPFQSVPKPPGDGGDVTVAGETFAPLIPLDQNTLWQNLNKAMNVNLKLNLAPFSDWAFGKFQAYVAGGDLADITMIPIGGVIPDLPQFLDTKAQDLTPFVGGDNVKEFPNLAALPTVGWKGMVYNGKIFAVPISQSLFYWALWGHQELLEQNNLNWPTDAASFKNALQKLTVPGQTKFGIGFEVGNRYAFALTNVGGQLWPALQGAPNTWAVDKSGKFTKDYETDQFKAAVQMARDFYAAGVYDPDTSYTTPSADVAFETGRLAFRFDGAIVPNNFDAGEIPNHPYTPTKTPPWKIRLAPPFSASPSIKPQYNYGPGNFGLIILKKAPSERIKLLLNVINYIVAPFGSQEYLNAQYGVQGKDYDFDANGNPVRNKQGTQDIIAWNGVMGTPPPVIFDPNNKDFAPTMSAALKALGQGGVLDASLGLYSPTNQKSGFLVQQKFADAMIDIVTGRRPFSDYDGVLKDWQTSGGNTIKTELAQAYSALNG
ncbi:MAG TPA: hypothetical protein VFS62_01810 [Chloroflexota bacterium]|nr:hypothetical protein [Chloroflexota bacterium]